MTPEERIALAEQLQHENAQTLAEIAERQQRRPTGEAPVDWRNAKSVGTMTAAQYDAWHEAGQPPLTRPVERAQPDWNTWAADREARLMDILGDEVGKVLADERT